MIKRFAQRHALLAQRGSQSLEWMGLAGFIATVVCGATAVADKSGFAGQLSNLFMNQLTAPFKSQ